MRNIVGGGVPDAPRGVSGGGRCAGGMNPSPTGYLLAVVGREAAGGVKTPPYDAKDKGAAMARLRAGHARPLRGLFPAT